MESLYQLKEEFFSQNQVLSIIDILRKYQTGARNSLNSSFISDFFHEYI